MVWFNMFQFRICTPIFVSIEKVILPTLYPLYNQGSRELPIFWYLILLWFKETGSVRYLISLNIRQRSGFKGNQEKVIVKAKRKGLRFVRNFFDLEEFLQWKNKSIVP